MIIGIDACTWNNKRGFGRFTRELLNAMLEIDRENEYLFFVDSENVTNEKFPPNVQVIVIQTGVSALEAASATGRRSIFDIWKFSREVFKHKIDLFFFPAVYTFYPIFNQAKIVVTIHDVIADNHPEMVFKNWKLKLFWKLKQNLAIRQSNLILTVSQYSKQSIINYFKLPDSKVQAISEAPRSVFKTRFGINEISETLAKIGIKSDEKFLLYVGGISPHKNLDRLIESFHLLLANKMTSKIKLVLVGDYKDDPFYSAYPMLKKQISELHLENQVIFTGFIDDLELAHLYNAATLVVLPSLEEGFGLPAVEAMVCGTPVAASNRGSLPEVLGNAGRFFDPTNVSEMTGVIGKILNDENLRNEMKLQGLERAKEFSWHNAALATLMIFKDVRQTRN